MDPNYGGQQQQPQYGQPAYPTQGGATTVVVTQAPARGDDFLFSLIIFVIGFVFCPVWFAGCMYVKSADAGARIFGILSLVFASLGVVAIIIIIIVVATAAAAVTKAVQNNCPNYPYCYYSSF